MQLPVRHQDSLIAEDDAVYQMSYGYGITGSWLVEKRLYEALYGDTAVLNNNNLMADFYARIDSGERGIILQSEIQNRLLMDSATVLSTTKLGFGGVLSQAQYLNSILPDSIPGAYNYEGSRLANS
jgi:hypothetical protein